MIYFLRLAAWREAARGIGALLCNVIYSLISLIYQLFITVSRLNILSEESIAPIYQRVTMILTIVMTFYITFEFIKYVIEPDTLGDKEKGVGNLAFRMVAVVVLIAFVPRIFTLAYKVQTTIIENQVFSKVILGKKNLDFGKLGGEFSANVLSQFYYLDTNSQDACANMGGNCQTADIAVNNNLANLEIDGTADISYGINLTAKTSSSGITWDDTYKPAIKFDGIMAILVGGLIVYILAMYCIDVGVRYAQLIFLQIMAPVAIMGYLSPKKDGIFQKWYKQCFTTYIDLFIRIAIIYFVLLIISILGDSFSSGTLFAGIDGGNVTTPIKVLSYIVLVIGLLAFAQRAPKLLSELLPSSGAAGIGFGLAPKERAEAVSTFRRVTGGIGGFVAGGVAGRSLKAALEGAKKGSDKNTKGLIRGSTLSRMMDAAAAGKGVLETRRDIKNNGGTVLGTEVFSDFNKSEAQKQDRRIANLENMKNKKKTVSTAVENIKFRQQLETMSEAISKADPNAATAWVTVKKKAESYARQYADGKMTFAEMQTKVQEQITKFNTEHGNLAGTPTLDYEENSSKWGTVNTAIQEAKKAAQEVQNETYKDRDGNEHKIGYDEATFAEKIGDYSDNSETAAEQFKATDAYKRAHANAKGADGKK